MVNQKRLEQSLAKMASIGAAPGGGYMRLAFSDADWEARKFIRQLMEDAGLAVRTDAVGNLIGRREGRDPAAPVVMMGSHIDSVPHGGNYDGVVGVLGAIEAVKCLQENGIMLDCPVEVVVFVCEESSRFGDSTLGSKALCGKLAADACERLRDRDGMTLGQCLRRVGLDPARVGQARYSGDIKAYLEIHIEQGKVLETMGRRLGVVSGIAAPTRLEVIVEGRADHSGATPMTLRSDALAGAAEIVLAVERLARAAGPEGVVGTVGVLKPSPGAMNVIPGRVEMGVDIRGISRDSKDRVLGRLMDEAEEIKNRRGLRVAIRKLVDETPVKIESFVVAFLENECRAAGHPFMTLPSGAGHDAMHIAALAPAGMLFIPCRGGVSHNPAEFAAPEDIAAGAEVLYGAVCKLAAKGFRWPA